MSTSILAIGIPSSVSDTKLEEFFSFCGTINSISLVDNHPETKTVSYKVTFQSASAVSTALLLNGAELDGHEIHILEQGVTKQRDITSLPPSYEEKDPNAVHLYEESDIPPIGPDGKIPQEAKPKSAILAEYLSRGYVLSDTLVNKAIEFDQQRGSKLKTLWERLEAKYHEKLDKNSGSWDEKKKKLDAASEKFKQDKYGSKIHEFYKNVAKDASDVHKEAKRLAKLKLDEQNGVSHDSTSYSSEKQ